MTELDPASAFVERMLNLSTAHLPNELLPLLEIGEFDILTYSTTYGGLVFVDEFSEYPALMKILNLARELGCTWVRFDCDGPLVSELEIFEHE